MSRMLPSILALALLPAVALAQPAKKTITREADLPRFTYPMSGRVEDLLKDEKRFKPLAAHVRKNVESVLAQYNITERATQRQLVGVLMVLDYFEGKDADVARRLEEIKALEEKPAKKLMSGTMMRVILEARRTSRDRTSPAYRQAFARALLTRVQALPFDVVQDELKGLKSFGEIMSEALILGQLRSTVDPVVAKTGALSSEIAHALPHTRLLMIEMIPMTKVMVEVLGPYLAAHKKEKPDIWAARDVALEPSKKPKPVTVAVWDSGVDLNLFPNQTAKDGKGNALVLAYDLHARKTTGELMALTPEQLQRRPELQRLAKGFSDLQANLDTREATELKRRMAKMRPDQVKPFIEDLVLYSIYAHGTHVAGLLTAGNPAARVVVGRITYDHKLIPDPCPSKELSERSAAALKEYVAFFKRHKVRVVNMSWGTSLTEFEQGLEKCGIGKVAEERKKLARELFAIERTAFEKAVASAPEILFVAAAGNSANDPTFQETFPSSTKLPHLVTVGAVDRAGDEAPFTSYGPTVVLHGNGYEVESFVPGGDRLKFSGTSMASPNVANLAAKMLAVYPKLKPAKVIEIMRATADQSTDRRRFLVNPKRALEAAGKR
jgi:subtilisin family serine protease